MSVRIGESSWKDSWREISSSSLDMVPGTLLVATLLGLVLGRRHPDIPSSLNHSEICDLNSPPAYSLMHTSKFVFTKEGLFFFYLFEWMDVLLELYALNGGVTEKSFLTISDLGSTALNLEAMQRKPWKPYISLTQKVSQLALCSCSRCSLSKKFEHAVFNVLACLPAFASYGFE